MGDCYDRSTPNHSESQPIVEGLLRLLHDLVNGLGHIIYIAGVQAGHADTAVLGHVDVRVGPNPEDLRLR